VWLRWNHNGTQTRQSAKTLSWELAAERARYLEQRYLDAELGKAPPPGAAKRVDEAIALFMDSKRGEDLAANTLGKYVLTLNRLQAFCDGEGLLFAKDITLSHLTTLRAHWTFESPLAKRNNQERVKSFFKFCLEAGIIAANPAGQLSSIQVKMDEATRVRPFEPKEYKRILATVGKCGLQPRNAARVKACIQLQRWSGLSLVDAVCLSKDELVQAGKVFRVRVQRRKTGAHVNTSTIYSRVARR
jgi:site-specific recombinase XerD